MLDILNRLLQREVPSNSPTKKIDVRDILVATCALLLEMAHIDGEFSEAERNRILTVLEKEYNISQKEAGEIAEAAAAERKESPDLWRFTDLINKNYSEQERLRVIELIWQIIYVDEHLDKHEDYLVHKLARLLNLTHSQLIDTKLKVLHNR